MEDLFSGMFGKDQKELDFELSPRLFSVLGKSLDLAINAGKSDHLADLSCDLMITPGLPLLKRDIFTQFKPFYEMGRKCAEENIPKIQGLLNKKSNRL